MIPDESRLTVYGWRSVLTYPFRGPEGERPVVATWVLLLLAVSAPVIRFVSVLGLAASLLFAFPLVGYLIRVLVVSENGTPAPPLLGDSLTLLRQGVGGLVICFVFLAIPFTLLAVTVYGALYTDQTIDPDAISNLVIYAGSITVLMLSFLGAYLLPVGLATYGQRGSLRAAFSPGEIRSVITHAAYFSGCTASFGVLGFATAIAVEISGVHRGGPVLGTAIVAYSLLVTVHIWGRMLARAR